MWLICTDQCDLKVLPIWFLGTTHSNRSKWGKCNQLHIVQPTIYISQLFKRKMANVHWTYLWTTGAPVQLLLTVVTYSTIWVKVLISNRHLTCSGFPHTAMFRPHLNCLYLTRHDRSLHLGHVHFHFDHMVNGMRHMKDTISNKKDIPNRHLTCSGFPHTAMFRPHLNCLYLTRHDRSLHLGHVHFHFDHMVNGMSHMKDNISNKKECLELPWYKEKVSMHTQNEELCIFHSALVKFSSF